MSSKNDPFSHPRTDNNGRSFHPFPRLPPRLRATIWALALPRGRIQFLPNGPGMRVRGLRAALAHATVAALPGETHCWFLARRDVLFISQCYPYRDVVRDGGTGAGVVELCAAASTVALEEANVAGQGLRHDGFLADLARSAVAVAFAAGSGHGSSGSSHHGGGARFPALREVLVVTDYRGPGLPLWSAVFVGGGEWRHAASKYNDGVRFVRPGVDHDDNDARRTTLRFRTEVLPCIEAKLLRLLRIEYARQLSGSGRSGAGAGSADPRDVWACAEALGRDHPWMRRVWERLPRFTQVVVKHRDGGW